MNKNHIYQPVIGKFGKYLFAVPWLIFGIQHYMYAGFVTGLVPAFMPFKLFWVYFTGTAMIAAAISFIIDIKAQLAAWLLATMLCLFILMLHIPNLIKHPDVEISRTRALQDMALMGGALLLTRHLKATSTGRILFALGILALGCLHFMHVGFITAKIPTYFPAINFFDYVVGAIMIIASFCIIKGWQLLRISIALGFVVLCLTLLYYIPLLVLDIYNGTLWTGCMLNIALAGAAFIIPQEDL